MMAQNIYNPEAKEARLTNQLRVLSVKCARIVLDLHYHGEVT